MKKYFKLKGVLVFSILILIISGFSFKPTPAYATCASGPDGTEVIGREDTPGFITEFNFVSLVYNSPTSSSDTLTLSGSYRGSRTITCTPVGQGGSGYPTSTYNNPYGRIDIINQPIPITVPTRRPSCNYGSGPSCSFTENFNVRSLPNGIYTARLTISDGDSDIHRDVQFTIVRGGGALPDLTANAPSPSTATKDIPVSFSSTITNIGGASTGNSFPNFFQIATAANGAGTITDLASSTMSILASGGTATATSPSTTFTSAGVYSVRVCADKSSGASAGVIAESNEGNNCGGWTAVTVSTTTPKPDLTAAKPFAGIFPAPGVPGTFTSNIKNIGSETTGNTPASFYNFFQTATSVNANGDGIGVADILPAQSMPTPLASGGSANATANITFATTGIYYVRACADKSSSTSAGVIIESNEYNNCSAWLTVNVIPEDLKPDLIAGAPTPRNAIVNEATSFTASIENIRNKATSSSFTNLLQIATGPGGSGTIVNKDMSDITLLGGESKSVSGSHTFTLAGTYYIRACADADTSGPSDTGATGTISESNEGNNCSPSWTAVNVSTIGVAITADPNPVILPSGATSGETTLTWTTSGNNITSCEASSSPSSPAWSGSKDINGGSELKTGLTIAIGTYTYEITCVKENSDGDVISSSTSPVTVTVRTAAAGTNGQCGIIPPTNKTCKTGAYAGDYTSYPSRVTWTCNGTGTPRGNPSPLCIEQKGPGFIEN